jgi:hypothetical protein
MKKNDIYTPTVAAALQHEENIISATTETTAIQYEESNKRTNISNNNHSNTRGNARPDSIDHKE